MAIEPVVKVWFGIPSETRKLNTPNCQPFMPTSLKDIMLGYMTAKEALAAGFTNHGSYFGIPLWMTDEGCPMVAAKWMPMEYVMSLFHYIEGFLQMMNPEPGFHFYIGPPIEQ